MLLLYRSVILWSTAWFPGVLAASRQAQFKVNLAFNTWIWPLLGLIFLPWATLMYVIVFPVVGFFDWSLLGLALATDIAGYVGGVRNRTPDPGVFFYKPVLVR